MKLENKTILITGGSSGIGLELAKQLRQRGNTVIVTGRDQQRLDAARSKIPGLFTYRSDVADENDIRALYEQVIKDFPGLDVLINNAGIMRNLDLQQPRELHDVTREVQIDLEGPIRLIQQFLPHLKTRKDALIVNVSSGLAFVPFPLSPVYSAAKAGLHAYSQCLRIQLRDTGVTVVELAPPGVETPLFRGEFAEEMKNQKGMDVTQLAQKAIAGIEAGKLEIRPGLSNVLKILSRIAPTFILNQMAKTVRSKP
jgi:uncharacterized oxidoreductase